MARVLLIDGGQSGCRVAITVDGRTIGSSAGSGLRRADLGGIGEAFAALEPGEFDVAIAGLSGFDGTPAAAASVAAYLRSLTPVGRVVVTNDAVCAYLGALGPQPGAVVAAGTGAIALASGDDGRWARADGWGTTLGDDGGGYWIGRRGLALAVRAIDGRGGSVALLRLAEARYGPSLVSAVYDTRDPVATVAAFATDVADAAHAGDLAAARVWADAGRELARTAAAALTRAFAPPAAETPLGAAVGSSGGGSPPGAGVVAVSWAGGLFAAGDLLLDPFAAELGRLWPAARVVTPQGSGLDGAALLVERPPLLASLVHVLDAGDSPP